MLDDPLNRIALLREILRRDRARYIPPPVPVIRNTGVREWGWTFPTIRQVMREGLPAHYTHDALASIDREVDVYWDGEQWFITLLLLDDAEVGPFDSGAKALKDARRWLKDEGYVLLDTIPWDEDDIKDYALP